VLYLKEVVYAPDNDFMCAAHCYLQIVACSPHGIALALRLHWRYFTHMTRFVFGIFFLVLFAVLVVGRIMVGSRLKHLKKQSESTDSYNKRDYEDRISSAETKSSIFRVTAYACVALGGLLFASSFMRIVPANTVGIPTTLGHVGVPMNSGFQLVAPWTEITEFSTRTQELSMLRAPDEGDKKKDDSVDVIANSGGSMKVDITVRFSIAKDKASDLFKLAGTLDLVKERFVRPDTREVVRNVFGQYSAEEGYSTKRAEIGQKITEELQKKFSAAGRGIIIDSINVRDVLPEAQVLSSINDILKTRNDAAKALEDQKKQVTEAETRKQVATRDADAKITAANADASAVKIAADAQAEANAKIAASLTPELVDLEKTKACADAISQSKATVINVCGNAQAGSSSGTANGAAVIVDGRPAGG